MRNMGAEYVQYCTVYVYACTLRAALRNYIYGGLADNNETESFVGVPDNNEADGCTVHASSVRRYWY
jgi:hypothetical protein